MADHEKAQPVDADAAEVFAWLSDVSHLPDYLPPVVAASIEGPAEGGKPGRQIKTTLQNPKDDQTTFDAVGYLFVDEAARRMEWGAEAGRDYSGSLTVAEAGQGKAEVTVRLSFGPRSAEGDISASSGEAQDPLEEGIAATLESIRRQIEEGSGKLQPPPPPDGAEPALDENPAVVDEQPRST